MAKLKKSLLFWLLYAVFTLCLIALALGVLFHVHSLLVEYESSQPEHLIRQLTEELEACAKNGTLWEYIPRPEEIRSRFDTTESIWDTYEKKLSAGEFTFARQSGNFSADTLSYVILLEEEAIASVEIRSENTRTELAVFTFSDWSVVSITPLATAYSYSCEFRLPEGFSATVNGLALAETEFVRTEDKTQVYLVENLAAAPAIAVFDAYGTEAAYDIEEGVLIPVTHRSELSVPQGLTVSLNGLVIDPVSSEDGFDQYVTLTADVPEIRITDDYGGSAVYTPGMTLTAGIRKVTLPETFCLRVGDVLLNPAAGVFSDNTDYPLDLPYAEDLPRLVTYSFLILDTTAVSVMYPDGTSEPLETVDGTEIRDIPTSEEAPPIDVLAVAKKWSLFMTDDLGGNDNGFGQIAKELLKGSYLYDVAYRWANGVDITFTSIHILKDPPFGKEIVADYRAYSARLFSCRVYLEKYMRLNSGLHVTDAMHSTLWFSLTDDGWKLTAMQEITEDPT